MTSKVANISKQISIFTVIIHHLHGFFAMKISTSSVEDWFARLVKHDDYQAFESIFHHFYKTLCRYALKYVHSPEIAEEVVSDVFFKVWKNRAQISIHTSLQAYLYMSVRNQALDYLKSRTHLKTKFEELPLHLENGYAAPDEELIAEELDQRIEKAIDTLPPQCQAIFRLSRDKGLKYKEIAEQLNLSIKTVETQMGRALKQLRLLLQDNQTALLTVSFWLLAVGF